MKLIVNGEERVVAASISVADLLAELGLAGRRVAVELNREILARDRWAGHALADGDQLEIVHFVGGG